MRSFLFQKIKFGKIDKQNPLYYSLASRTRIPYLLNFLPSGGLVLDLGCGTGFFSNIIAGKTVKVAAVDPDKSSLEKAESMYKKQNIKFIPAQSEKTPLLANSIDFLVCSEVLEHVDNLEKTLEEIKRVCKNGSRFFITVPTADGIFGNFFLKIGHDDSSKYERHKRSPFSKKSISKILLDHDFKIKKTYYSKILFAEMFMGLTKLFHNLIKGKMPQGQSDILMPPKVYQKFFPIILFLAKLEDFILNDILRGHMIIITGKIKK